MKVELSANRMVLPQTSRTRVTNINPKINPNSLSNFVKGFIQPKRFVDFRPMSNLKMPIFKLKNAYPTFFLKVENCKEIFGHQGNLGSPKIHNT